MRQHFAGVISFYLAIVVKVEMHREYVTNHVFLQYFIAGHAEMEAVRVDSTYNKS